MRVPHHRAQGPQDGSKDVDGVCVLGRCAYDRCTVWSWSAGLHPTIVHRDLEVGHGPCLL